MDTECLEPLAPLFDASADVWLGRMGNDADFPHSIPNAIMASRSFQEFWLLAMHFLVENATTTVESHTQALAGPETMTGSILLKKTYNTYVSGKRDAVREMIRRVAVRFPVNLRPEPTVSTIELLEPSCWYPITGPMSSMTNCFGNFVTTRSGLAIGPSGGCFQDPISCRIGVIPGKKHREFSRTH